MKAKRIIALSLAAVMAISTAVMTGCGSSGDSSSSDGGSTGKKTTLEVLTHRTDRVEDGSLDEWTKPFEEANNCDIEYVGYTDYASDVSTRMNTDDYGDVLMIPDSVAVKDLGNFFEPLADYDVAKEKWECANQKMYDNKVYGYPTGLNLAGGYYTTRMFSLRQELLSFLRLPMNL